MHMTIAEHLKLLFFKLGIKQADVAALLKMSPQSFSAKLKRNSFSCEELEKIGELTGCKFVLYFELPNGEKIGNRI